MTGVAFFAGCGLKANPSPPESAHQPQTPVQVLNVTAGENAARLYWRMDGALKKAGFVSIEKSVLGSGGNICRNCPRTYETIAQLMLSGVRSGENEYTYIDSAVERGKVYSYRLKICDRGGACFESQAAELDYQ